MKIVRLTRAELADWRQNTHHLVDAEGHLTAKLDRGLESALAQVTRMARSQRKTLNQRVAIAGREYLIVVDIRRTGINAEDFSFEATIDGQRVVTGRQVVAAQMLQKHGECQLRAPNNVILKVVRDPGVHRPTLKEAQQIAPKPDHCECRNWGRPHPGTHYPTCPWNRLAPPDERAPSDAVPEAEVQLLPTEAFASLKASPAPNPAFTPVAARVDPRAVVVDAPPLDSPDNCRNGCLEWATPEKFPIPAGQHHPTCEFAKPWAIKTTKEIPRWLVDLRTGEKVRHATDAEIGEADVVASRTGSPIIHVDDVPYAVILQTELDAEAALTPNPSPTGAAA